MFRITGSSKLTVWLALFSWLAGSAYAADTARLQGAADREGLAQSRAWLALLHYRHAADKTTESYVDDSRFFVSPTGYRDPAAELRATIELLVNEPAARCRFPARYDWLREQLDWGDLPVTRAACPEYDAWRAEVNATDVVLVFAASYVNSPSSMYGHTFLRFDPADVAAGSTLLSYALNFGASVTGNDAGLLYAWRGIAGGYPGNFSSSAYLEKTKEYSRLENRDLWEYHLDLSEKQVGRMLAHVWELNEIVFDYYFFDENCSFRLLELIEVARPDLDLTSEFGAFAIPLDTVRAVERAGLIDAEYYRPSNQTVVSLYIDELSRREQALALRLAHDISVLDEPDFTALDEAAQVEVAYTAYKYLRYEVNENAREADIADRSYALLAFLAVRDQSELDEREPAAVDPLEGHGTMMLAAAGGADDGRWFTDLEWRLAYHDLLDNTYGYPRDTSLNMGRLILRYREGDGLQLQKLDLIEITSVPYRDEFYKPIAWQTSVGLDRQWTDGRDELTVQGNGGVGLSYRSVFDGRLLTFLRGRAEYNDRFRDGKFDVAAGVSVGYLRQGRRGNTLLQFETLHFVGGTDRQLLEAQQSVFLGVNHALKFNLKRSIDESDGYNEASIGYRYYF